MAYVKEAWRASVQNGAIPRDKLAQVVPTTFDIDLQGPAVMHPEAAAAMSAWLAEAKATGHGDLRVKYSYRTLAKQREKWENFQNGGNLAAVPGTSNHGWAVTVDFSWSFSGTIAWAHATAARFGFLFDVPSENWHATYQGGFKEMCEKCDQLIEGINAYLERNEPKDAGPAKKLYRALKAAETRGDGGGSGVTPVSKAVYDIHKHQGSGPTGPPVA